MNMYFKNKDYLGEVIDFKGLNTRDWLRVCDLPDETATSWIVAEISNEVRINEFLSVQNIIDELEGFYNSGDIELSEWSDGLGVYIENNGELLIVREDELFCLYKRRD